MSASRSSRLASGPSICFSTASASWPRPLLSSQRGDSGVPKRSRRMRTAGIALLASIQRQSSWPEDSIAQPTTYATAAPTDHMVTMMTSSGPREFRGANSEAMVPAIAKSAPMAMPMRKRSAVSCQGSVTKNWAAESRMKAAMSKR